MKDKEKQIEIKHGSENMVDLLNQEQAEIKKAKKIEETAEKFYTLLKQKGKIITEFDWNDYLKIDIDELKIIAKQFGVEIKE